MKSIRVHAFGGPEVLKLEEVPAPPVGKGAVRIDVKAIGVNPVDTYIRSGKYGDRPFPYTPGADAAGIVETIGEGVTRAKVGDRVYVSHAASGSYAEKVVADQSDVYPLPEKLTFAQGAAIGVPYGTAWKALHVRAQAKAGETVLIHGATGGVGIAAVQMARAAGLIVFGTGGSDEGRKLATREGAHHMFDHHDKTYQKQIMDRTGGRGVDLILEMLANVNLSADLTMLAKFGRVIVVGNRGTIEINPRDTMARDTDIRGMTMMNATPAELIAWHAGIGAGLENGTLRPIIDKEMPLTDAAKAHVEVLEGNSHGKIVLIP